MLLTCILPDALFGQNAKNRSVEVSVKAQENPPRFDFSWPWDWSEGGYTIYKKDPGAADWGEPIGTLPWGATAFSDTDIAVGQPYEYAFFKKGFEKIIDTIEVAAGGTLTFTIHNIYGNGLCCNFGFGWYEVAVCGETVASGSGFGMEETTTFTVCDNGSPTEKLVLTINPDMLPNNTWWKLTDSAGAEVASSGPPGTLLAERPKYGFILAGMQLPETESRGGILLLVDDVYTQPLAAEIAQLEEDFIKDGWTVVRRGVNRNDPVSSVKALIVNEYNQHPELNTVYLLGHIPVPYSGDMYPDGHLENHWGAWPADVYYGDMDGIWTDETVSNTMAQFPANHNLPGDGKFDQSGIPSAVELAVGRVDLYDMPAFGLNDTELTRRYLQKAHLFKTGQLEVQRRALVDDNLNIVLGAPAASGWRNFAPIFGADSVFAKDYFSTMKTESYLWSYGCGSGSHVSANGIGTTADFAADTLRNIFTMLLGSQFGDWDNTNNFLRAPLASPGWTLTNCWAGNPPWTLHHMAMGYPIGYNLLVTQNATEEDYNPGPQLVHTALMGDPTLRLHPVKPVENLTATTLPKEVQLNWTPPSGETIAGYHIYRADSLHGTFSRLISALVTDTFYMDAINAGSSLYMVRAVKLETSGSGTYWNLSLGTLAWSGSNPCEGLPLESHVFFDICQGEGVMIGDSTYTETGIYKYPLLSAIGCDSIVNIHLTVLHIVEVEIDTFFQPPGIWFHGSFYQNDTTVTVHLTGSNGCDSILTAHLYLMTGTNESRTVAGFSVWPNPSSGVVFIEIQDAAGWFDVEVMDGLGRRVFSQKVLFSGEPVGLDLRELAAGVYFLKISGDGFSGTEKVILRIK